MSESRAANKPGPRDTDATSSEKLDDIYDEELVDESDEHRGNVPSPDGSFDTDDELDDADLE